MFMIRSVPTFDVSRMIVFLKSMCAAFAVLHPALVEHLEEDLVHVGVRLLDFVEQHDAVGPPAHRLGQHAALAVADVAREARPSACETVCASWNSLMLIVMTFCSPP